MVVWVPEGRAPHDLVWSDKCWPAAWPKDVTVLFYGCEDVPAPVASWINRGATFVAHNAESFDAEAWARLVKHRIEPEWYDTIHTCRAAGLPAGLDAACKALGVPGKDDDGKRALKLLYTARARAGYVEYPVGTTQLWERMLAYNIGDVLGLRAVYEATDEFGEQDVLLAHGRINARGIPVDIEFAALLRALWLEYQAQAARTVHELTEEVITGDDTRSPQKVKAWLKTQGIDMPSLERKVVEQLIDDPDSFFGDTDDPRVARVITVLRERAQAVRATPAKVERAINSADSDSRVRNVFVYHGAHTGRFSGRDLQPHNFARGVKFDTERALALYGEKRLDLAAVKALCGKTPVGDALATLMRPVIRAARGKRLVPVDYSAVEGRGLAWIASERNAMAIFNDPAECIYCDMATKLYARKIVRGMPERQVGKQIVLGCGYGMGANKFGDQAKFASIDLEAAGTSAEACVKAYRGGYPAIPALWRAFNRAAFEAVEHGRSTRVGKCLFERSGSWLTIMLPSRRKLRYRNPRVEMQQPKWAPTGEKQRALVYDSPHGYQKTIYGGLIAENVVQGLCRDLLAHALVVLDNRYPVVMHVHDEAVFEVSTGTEDLALRQACEVMSTPPWWAEGFPLRVEGFTCEHYSKAAFSTSWKCDAMLGRVLEFKRDAD
jgi:DNA polymerase